MIQETRISQSEVRINRRILSDPDDLIRFAPLTYVYLERHFFFFKNNETLNEMQ